MQIGGAIKGFGAQKQAGRGQHRALRVAAHQAVALLGVLPKMGKGRVQVAMQSHQGLRSQVVKHGRGVVKKQGQVVLNARGGHAIAHVFVDAAFGRVALEQFAPAAAKFGARRLVHGELATGQQPHLGHRVQAALAVGVKGADGVDFVVEQIHPVRHQGAHREQVDQATPHRVFAGADHLCHVVVARQRELGAQGGLVKLLLDLEVKGVAGQK